MKNCMNYMSGHAEHRRFKKGAGLKQDFFHLLVGAFFRREMTHVKQDVRIYDMCCEFMVFRFMCNAVPSLMLSRQTK